MKIYKNNIGTKAVSVLLSFIVWLYVASIQPDASIPEFTRTIPNVPVELIGSDKNYQYLVTPSTVDIVIRGSQDFVNHMMNREHKVTVDVRNIGEGIHNLEVKTSIAGGVVQGIHPNYVTVVVEPISTNRYDIDVETTGNLPEGLAIKSINVKPATVSLTGPSSELERVSKVVATLNLDNITETTEIATEIFILDNNSQSINSLQANKTSVIIEVVIEQQEIEQEIVEPEVEQTEKLVEIETLNLGEEYDANLSPSKIKVKYPDDLDVASLKVYIDLEGLVEGEHVLPLQVDGPEGVVAETQEVKVSIKERE